MTGKIRLATGANSSIGKATARALVDRGAWVIVHGGNAEKLKMTVAELSAVGYGAVEPVEADLSVFPR